MLKNAVAYITRKKNRTLIIFIILTIVFSCLYSCLGLLKSSNNIEKSLYEISNSSLSITKKDGETFEISRFNDLKKIKEIEDIVFQYNGLAKPIKDKVVDGEQKIQRDNLPDELNNVLSVEATNNTKKNILFNSGVFTIKEGRDIGEKDKNKILIHEEFAKKNNLKLNDTISLEMIGTDNNSPSKVSKYQVIGIFSGKKQETYTGLSSDFSENMVFVDYDSSQEALGKSGNNKLVNKIFVYSGSEDATKSAFNKIKAMKVDWSKYILEKDNKAFEESLESVSGIKNIIKIMTYSIMLSGLVVLSLILVLWLRQRIYEIGILLSIGISKLNIILQFIIELLFISVPSIISSFILGNILLKQFASGFINSEQSMVISSSLINKGNLLFSIGTLAQSYLILVSIIILSVIISSSMILLKKPKEILSKIS